MKKLFVLIVTLGSFATSCAVVKPYERVSLNDPDMELSNTSASRYEGIFQTYREGASGGNGSKTGGGCGCN